MPVRTLNYIKDLFKAHIRNTQFSWTGSGTNLDDGDEEPLLVLLVHGAGDAADGPAQRVQVLPAPLSPVHLYAIPYTRVKGIQDGGKNYPYLTM